MLNMFHIKKWLKKGRQNIITLIKRRSSEDKKKLQEYNKQWFNNQTREKQLELRQKAQKHDKNRYDNMTVKVKQIIIFTGFLFPFHYYVKQWFDFALFQF